MPMDKVIKDKILVGLTDAIASTEDINLMDSLGAVEQALRNETIIMRALMYRILESK